MKRKLISITFGVCIILSMSITSFAGEWRSDAKGWWYDNGDGSYPKSAWQWIAGNEYEYCYYFNSDGYLLTNTKTPDGYFVDADGRWKDGYIVKERPIQMSYKEFVNRREKSEKQYNPNAKVDITSSSLASEYYWKYMSSTEDAALVDRVSKKCQLIEQNPSPEFVKTQVVEVEVPIWKLGKNGAKVPSKARLTVLAEIKDEVYQIFNEIYNGPEKFPIKDLGAYQWRSNGLNSLHSYGLAIDINSNENSQMSVEGDRALVGTAWQPYTNPYSITPDGDVAKAFGRHGFGWGAAFSRADYMHFEF